MQALSPLYRQYGASGVGQTGLGGFPLSVEAFGTSAASPDDYAAVSMPSHTVIEEWMGEKVETLEDLLCEGLRAVCVGINPSPVSVSAGHYYQGRAGQRFFERLRQAGVLPASGHGSEDDAVFASGIGFTDVIKRPSANAKALAAGEFEYGRRRLEEKLKRYRPQLIIFVFKKTAEVLLGRFPGNGFVPGLFLAHSHVFVMPGIYESATTVAATMRALKLRWQAL